MTRVEAIRAILDFAGSLGPFLDPNERDRREEEWVAVADMEMVKLIVDLVLHPPLAAELGRTPPEDFEYEVSRVLTLIGARAPAQFLAYIAPFLGDARARATIIEVIGSLGVQEGLSWLAPLVADRGLAEEAAVCLACALGEIGGIAALVLLDRFKCATPSERTRVLREIRIARDAAQGAIETKPPNSVTRKLRDQIGSESDSFQKSESEMRKPPAKG